MKNYFLLSTLLVLMGCASIVGSTSETINISSNRKENIVIYNKENIPVYRGSLPATISLKKKAGYFSGETYTISSEKDGTTKILDTSLYGWYWGNILLGGVIGMFIVDPLTGAMWTFDEPNVVLNGIPSLPEKQILRQVLNPECEEEIVGMKIFDTYADSTKNYALGYSCQYNMDNCNNYIVALPKEKGKIYFDEQKVSVPDDKCIRFSGNYTYNSQNLNERRIGDGNNLSRTQRGKTVRTVPVVEFINKYIEN